MSSINRAISRLLNISEGIDEDKLKRALRVARSMSSPDKGLSMANDLLGGFGVEYISEAGRELGYVDLGGTYDQTICFEDGEGFWIGSWGDWVEEVEAQQSEEEGMIRCAYCGEYTPIDPDKDWRETVCQHCGWYVDGSGKAPEPSEDDEDEAESVKPIEGQRLQEAIDKLLGGERGTDNE